MHPPSMVPILLFRFFSFLRNCSNIAALEVGASWIRHYFYVIFVVKIFLFKTDAHLNVHVLQGPTHGTLNLGQIRN